MNIKSGFSLYQGKKTKKYKELGPAKLPPYKPIHSFYPDTMNPNLPVYEQYIFFHGPKDLVIKRFHCNYTGGENTFAHNAQNKRSVCKLRCVKKTTFKIFCDVFHKIYFQYIKNREFIMIWQLLIQATHIIHMYKV